MSGLTIDISSMIRIERSDRVFLIASLFSSVKPLNLLPNGRPKVECIVAPFIAPAAIPVKATFKTTGRSDDPGMCLRINDSTLYAISRINFVFPVPKKNSVIKMLLHYFAGE